MSGGRPRRVAEQDIPSCPRHGRNFRCKLDGTYGRVRKRQRYRCFPPDLASHSFVESLPRQLTPDESCPTCEQRLALPGQGFQSAKMHRFSAREIAQALMAAGRGESYTRAGRTLRRIHGRQTTNGGRLSSDASLVMDWVEVFAPVLGEVLLTQHLSSGDLFSPSSKEQGVLLVDDLPFHIRSWKTRTGEVRERKQSGRRIFAILGAAHYVGGKMRIFRLRAVPTASSERHWIEFLHDIPDHGYPPRVVLADEGTGLPGALRQLWPQSSVQAACVYHLRAQLELMLRELGLTTPARRDVFAGIQVALQPPQSNWDSWSASALRLHAPRLTRWITRKSAQIRRQIGWSYWPVSIGALELSLQRIKAMIDRRRFAYRNRKRLDRLLTLIALHLNEQDNEVRYSEIIRAHLLVHYGRPYYVRHEVYDRRGQVPSLRVA